MEPSKTFRHVLVGSLFLSVLCADRTHTVNLQQNAHIQKYENSHNTYRDSLGLQRSRRQTNYYQPIDAQDAEILAQTKDVTAINFATLQSSQRQTNATPSDSLLRPREQFNAGASDSLLRPPRQTAYNQLSEPSDDDILDQIITATAIDLGDTIGLGSEFSQGYIDLGARDYVKEGAVTLAFVFDTTGSMFDDMQQVIDGAGKILNTVLEKFERPIHNYVFVPFHDPSECCLLLLLRRRS